MPIRFDAFLSPTTPVTPASQQGLAGFREGMRMKDQRARDAENFRHMRMLEDQKRAELELRQQAFQADEAYRQQALQQKAEQDRQEQINKAIMAGHAGNPLWRAMMPDGAEIGGQQPQTQAQQPAPQDQGWTGQQTYAPPQGPREGLRPLESPEPTLDEVLARATGASTPVGLTPQPGWEEPDPGTEALPTREADMPLPSVLDPIEVATDEGLRASAGTVPSADDILGMHGIDAKGDDVDDYDFATGAFSTKTAASVANVSRVIVDSATLDKQGVDPNDPFAVARAKQATRVARAVDSIPGGARYKEFAEGLVNSGVSPEAATRQVTAMIMADQRKDRRVRGAGKRLRKATESAVAVQPARGRPDMKDVSDAEWRQSRNIGLGLVKEKVKVDELKGWKSGLDDMAQTVRALNKRGANTTTTHIFAAKRIIGLVESGRISDKDLETFVGANGSIIDELRQMYMKNLGAADGNKQKALSMMEDSISEMDPSKLRQMKSIAGDLYSGLKARVDESLAENVELYNSYMDQYNATGYVYDYAVAEGIRVQTENLYGAPARKAFGTKSAKTKGGGSADDAAKALLGGG